MAAGLAGLGLTLAAPAQHTIGGRPFYEYTIPVATGDTVIGPDGQSYLIADLWPNLGLNNRGQLAVPGQVILNGASNVATVVYEDSPNNQLRLHLALVWNDGIDLADYLSVITYAAINDAGEFVYDTDSLGIGPWGTYIRFTDGSKKFLFCDRESPTSDRVMSHRHPDISDDGHVVAQGIEVRPSWLNVTNWLMSSPPTAPLLYSDTARESYPLLRLSDAEEVSSDNFFPVVAHGGVKAVVAGNPTNGSVYRFNAAGTQQALATAPGDFERLGTRVGLSGDGQAAVFLGRRADGVEGIFLSLFGSGFVLPDLATPILDTNTTFAVGPGGEPIRFSEFFTSNGLFVAFQDRNADGQLLGASDLEGDSLLVAFVAKPTGSSRLNPATGQPMFFNSGRGIWVARFDLHRGMTVGGARHVNLRTVTPVVQLGDLINAEPISELYLAGFGQATREADGSPRRTADGRPELGDHVVAFHATTMNARYAVKAYHLDTDGDGLLDHWERAGGGVDIAGDGTLDVDLAALGADELHKDLFVELDWTAPRPVWSYPGGWRNEPTRGELEKLRDRFQSAPVNNPDGFSGIRLHVDAGVGLSVGGMQWAPLPMLRGGEVVTTSDGQRPAQVAVDPDHEYFGDTQYIQFRTAKMDDVKKRHFLNVARGARELAFRYGVLADFARVTQFATPFATQRLFRVVSATRREIIGESETVGAPDDPAFQKSVHGIVFLEGSAAGQARRVQYFCPPGGFGGNPALFRLKCHSNEVDLLTLPNPGDQFVLGTGYAGDSEVFVYTNANNLHRLPGNDFAITLGAWGRRADGGLGNESKVWRSMMHELGHTMGLMHGGHDVECKFKGLDFLSRMNYSHSNRSFTNDVMPVYSNGCGSAVIDLTNGLPAALVNSFSDGTDPEGMNEYAYLRMAPWGTPWLLGNTLLTLDAPLRSAHSEDVPDSGPPPFEPDLEGPLITLPAPAARTAALGAPLTVTFGARDASGVDTLAVHFDLNGDGVITSALEQVAATPLGGDQYQALFSNVTGTATGRLLEVAATDQRGNASAVRAVYRVGGFVVTDTTAPSTYFLDCCPARLAAGSPHDIRLQVYGEGSGPLDGISSIACYFDADGDGVTNVPAEVTTAGPDEDGYWRTRVGPLSGPPGNRRMRVVAEDLAGNRSTNSAVFTVLAADAGPPVIVAISLTNLMVVPLGPAGVPVPTTIRDDQCLTSIRLYFDSDGDGTNALVESIVQEFYFCETNASPLMTLGYGGISGPMGVRTALVTVADAYGYQTTAVFAVQVADTQPPAILMVGPLIDQLIGTGTLEITGSALDDQFVTNLVVRVDLDGDGLFTGPGEVVGVDPTNAAAFVASFAGFTGSYGERRIVVEADDPLGQRATQDFIVHFGPGLRALSPLPSDPVSIGSTVLAVVESPDATNLVMALDLNGDGDRGDPGETVTGEVRNASVQYTMEIKVTEGLLGAVEGSDGTRTLHITGFSAAGDPLSLQVPLHITNDAIFAAARSRRIGGVPVHPDPQDYVTWNAALHAPRQFTPFGSNLLFLATTDTEGEALWISDGTPRGTRMVKDSNPERDTSNPLGTQPFFPMGVNALIAYQGRVFFDAEDQDLFDGVGPVAYGSELWVTDGSPTGTYMVKDINPSLGLTAYSSSPGSFTVFSNRLLFSATHRLYGRELWATDGTETGTVLVADLEPGVVGSSPGPFVPMGGYLWFVASSFDLWRTDGTTTGTVRVLDNTWEEFPYFSILNLTAVGSRLFYVYGTNTTGGELWSSDGTATGSVLVADIVPGPSGSNPRQFIAFSNRLWFVATTPASGDELWVSDGTAPGTKLVRDLWPGTLSSRPANLTVHSGRLWFNAWDPDHGDELWSTDGTDNGLRREPEIGRRSGPATTAANADLPAPNATNLLSVADTLFLQADDGGARYGGELTRVDSNARPRLVRDVAPIIAHRFQPLLNNFYDGPDSGRPAYLTRAGDRFFFNGQDSLYKGGRVFISDGTGTGTRRLGGRVRNWVLPERVEWNGAPLFAATTGKGGRWLRLNGGQLDAYPLPLPTGVGGPEKVVASSNGLAFITAVRNAAGWPAVGVWAAPAPGAAPVQLLQLTEWKALFAAGNGWLIAGRDTNNVPSVWCSDGTPGGTHRFAAIAATPGWSYPAFRAAAGGKSLFIWSRTNASEVWVSDGTVGSTRPVRKFGTTEGLRNGDHVTINGTRIGLFASDASGTNRFWTLADVNADAQPGPVLSSSSGAPVIFDGRWVFGGNQAGTNFPSLWITDGTATGTVGFGTATSSIAPFTVNVQAARNLTVVNSRLYFAATYGTYGEEPFVTDGTPGGTRSLGNLNSLAWPVPNDSAPRQFTPLGSWVLFTAVHKDYGRELWRTDGTKEGTFLLKDIHPGWYSSEIASLTSFGGRVYFTARDPDHGRELWSTDGTQQGTLRVEDLVPGPGSSDPQSLLVEGTNLYFFALDGSEDHSLRALDNIARPPTPYENWLTAFAPGGGFAGQPWEDGDGDGWGNEMEYLFGSSPTDPWQRHPMNGLGAANFTYNINAFHLKFVRPANWRELGLWFQYEGSLDLYQFAPQAAEILAVETNGAMETVTMRFLTTASESPSYPAPERYFIRQIIRRD